MALGLLWLGLVLLGALQTKAQDSSPNLIPAPPLLWVPVEPVFQKQLVSDLKGQLQGDPREECQQRGGETGWAQALAQSALSGALMEGTPHAPIHTQPC